MSGWPRLTERIEGELVVVEPLAGGPAGAVQAVFTVLMIGGLLAAIPLARRDLVLSATASVLAFVALGKVLSPQYVIWLAPFAALAWVWRQRAVAGLTAAAIVLTHVEFPSRYFDLINEQTGVILVVGARNAVLLVALALLLVALARPVTSPSCTR